MKRMSTTAKATFRRLRQSRMSKDRAFLNLILKNSWGGLSNKDTKIFLMKLEDYTTAEIAGEVNINVTAVRELLTMLRLQCILWFKINDSEPFGLA